MIELSSDKPNFPAGHCQFCGYNLFSIRGELCPECGNSRFAWVEAPCEECNETCVFPVAKAGLVESCQFCRKSIDVPRAPAPTKPCQATFKKRFAAFGFVLVTTFVSGFLLLALLAGVGVYICVTGIRPNPWAVLMVSLTIAFSVGIAVGWKLCYQ